MAFSFNGGKDSTVLLHLIRIALALRTSVEPSNNPKSSTETQPFHAHITTFFFHNDGDFQDITDFTHQTNHDYLLHMRVLHGDFKAGLEAFLQETQVKAILLGTRRGDPNAPGQETFCPSSKGWPPFMRVNPILEWTYHDVWAFLRCAELPYCCLYDHGYTSLGAVSNTRPNDALAREDGTFAPAYLLPDARLERAGRGRSRQAERRESLKRGTETGTVGILVIGDEILSAKVPDVNMQFLAGELRACGWRVEQALFVRDDVSAIAKAVSDMSDRYDVVITAGGLGPTIDDVSMRGLAEALGRPVGRHPELDARLRRFFGPDVTEAHLKMAEAPEGSSEIVLIDYQQSDGSTSPFPLVRCRNIYLLPGVPSLVQQKWKAVKEDLKTLSKAVPFHSIVFRLRVCDETEVAAVLEAMAVEDQGVALGSYPVDKTADDGCGIVLTLESKDEVRLESARKRLLERLVERSSSLGGDVIIRELRDVHTI